MKGLFVIALLACLAVAVLGQWGVGTGAVGGTGSGSGNLVGQMNALQALSGRAGTMGGGAGAAGGTGSGSGNLVGQMKAMQALGGRGQGSRMGMSGRGRGSRMGMSLPTLAMIHASGNDRLRMWYFCSQSVWLCMWAENRY